MVFAAARLSAPSVGIFLRRLEPSFVDYNMAGTGTHATPRQQRAKTSRLRLRRWVPLVMACGFIAYFWVLLFLSIGLQRAAEPRPGTISIATSPINKANAAGHKLVGGLRGEPGDLRFIVYRDGGRRQGLGSIMKGLLMAIDLGHEFNRTVCVEWKAFRLAFDRPHDDICRNLNGTSAKVEQWNKWSGSTNSLKEIRQIMASDVKIVRHAGNHIDTKQYQPEPYESFFHPSEALKEKIPWKRPPKCVVHLRKGDNKGDNRPGLDEATLQLMVREFPADCYLITNNFDWYELFAKVGWGHPPWASVKPHQMAGSSDLELWVDWYTAMKAEKLYHTPSTFSQSASWAAGCSISRKIMGNANGTLTLNFDSPLQAAYEKGCLKN